MATLTKKQLGLRLAKQLADLNLTDKEINAIADRVLVKGMDLGRLGPCPVGICGDFFTPKAPKTEFLVKLPGIVKWEVFPYGIINPDRFHVRIAFASNEIQQRAHVAGGR